jgi:NitT/TauT family transport system ATP-binding protein
MIAVVRAAEMLNLVDTPRRMVALEPLGKRFVDAAAEERKAIWREQLPKLRLFREVRELMQREPSGEVSRELVLETIILRMPQENYEKAFETFIGWARFGDLFAYDETAEKVSAH